TQGIGVGLLVFAFVLCTLAQVHLGKSWRLGIDYQNETALVENGIYRYSRNPIFLSMVASVLGLFLIVPTAFTLGLGVLSYVLAQIQVRLEEEHLARLHDARYAEFCRRVPRWM